MPEILTVKERQILVVLAWFLGGIAILTVPPDLPYGAEIKIVLGAAALATTFIQKFLALSPDAQTAILGFVSDLSKLPPDELASALTMMNTLAPFVQSMATAATTPSSKPLFTNADQSG